MSSYTAAIPAAQLASAPDAAAVAQRVIQALTAIIDGSMIVEDRWSGPPSGLDSSEIDIVAALEHLRRCRSTDDHFDQAFKRMRTAITVLSDSATELVAAAEAGQLSVADIDRVLRLRNAAMAATNDRVGALVIAPRSIPAEKQLRRLIPFSLSSGEARRWRIRRRREEGGLQLATSTPPTRVHTDERGAVGGAGLTPAPESKGNRDDVGND